MYDICVDISRMLIFRNRLFATLFRIFFTNLLPGGAVGAVT